MVPSGKDNPIVSTPPRWKASEPGPGHDSLVSVIGPLPWNRGFISTLSIIFTCDEATSGMRMLDRIIALLSALRFKLIMFDLS
jgi:hypothetical protein